MPIQYREFAAIDKMLRMRSDASSFRATYSDEQIEVFRRFDADVEDMLATFGIGGRAGEAPRSGSAPLLRLLLQDEQARIFTIERYAGGTWERIADDVAARNLVQHVERMIHDA